MSGSPAPHSMCRPQAVTLDRLLASNAERQPASTRPQPGCHYLVHRVEGSKRGRVVSTGEGVGEGGGVLKRVDGREKGREGRSMREGGRESKRVEG
eukprot:3314429-Rhodomonas_salina.1